MYIDTNPLCKFSDHCAAVKVYMYIYIIYMHVWLYTFIYIYVCMCVHIDKCKHVYINVCI
jgi:hypothetical protein